MIIPTGRDSLDSIKVLVGQLDQMTDGELDLIGKTLHDVDDLLGDGVYYIEHPEEWDD